METRPPDAVYNLTRRSLLNDKLTVSDCASQPLKMLSLVVSELGLNSESALWLNPLVAAPGLPRVFPFDLLYLDKDYRVLESAEIGPGVEFPSYRSEVASALVLPQHTLRFTETKKGDRLMICSEKELQSLTAKGGSSRRAEVVASTSPSVIALAVEHSPFTTQNAAPQPTKSQVQTRGSQDSEQAELQRFFSQSREQARPEDSQPHPATPGYTRAAIPDSNSSQMGAAQKAAAPGNPELGATIPERPVPSRPSRSTTSFATSSLPLWRVSAPTAIASGTSSTHVPPSVPFQSASQGERGNLVPGPGYSQVATGKQEHPRASDWAGTRVHSTSVRSDSPSEDASMDIWSPAEPASEANSLSTQQKTAEPSHLVSPQEKVRPEPLKSSPDIETRDSRPERQLQPTGAVTVKLPSRTANPKPRLYPRTSESVMGQQNAADKNDVRKTFRSMLSEWLNPVRTPSDRRRSERRYVPEMFAHYFTGGAPKPHQVADISLTGFYLLTEDRWMTGTMIQMTMQKPSRRGGKQSITVLSRVVRRGSDGVGVEFVMPESIDSHIQDIQPSQATDRAALARFL